MNKREKMLAAAIGGLVLLLAIKYVVDRVRGSFTQQRREIAKLDKEIAAKKRVLRTGQAAADRLGGFEQRSLPREPEKASSAYRAWLLELLSRAGFADDEEKVTALPPRPHGEIYTRFTFIVAARGNLPTLTRFLHDFYSVDHLHRVKFLVMQPIKDSNDLDVTLQVEALSLPTSPHSSQLTTKRSDRLKGPVEDYLKAIVQRNCFSPPNKPPVLTVDAKSSYYDDETISGTAKAQDPDKDGISYELGKGSPPGAQIDPKTGQFSFRPAGPGDYEVLVMAKDDGLPSEVVSQPVKFVVAKRPPAPVAEERPAAPPGFDPSKFAFLTGITEVGGRPQIWIHIRTEGRLEKLHVGDQLQIGSVKAVVARIDEKRVELDAGGQRFVIALGDNLYEASKTPVSN